MPTVDETEGESEEELTVLSVPCLRCARQVSSAMNNNASALIWLQVQQNFCASIMLVYVNASDF